MYIEKNGSNEKRPIDITTFEDKVLQKGIKWLIEPIFEEDFYDCSYGFRPGRSQHDVLQELWGGLMKMRGGWIIDLDIRKCFNSIRWDKLREVIKQRVCDGVIIRLIGKWMNAGIMEEGAVHYTEAGVPQGGLCKALHNPPYAKKVIMKSRIHNLLY